MQSRSLGHRAVPIGGRRRDLFGKRRHSRIKPLLITATVSVCFAIVFAAGFKLGRTYQFVGVQVAGGPSETGPAVVIDASATIKE